MTDKIFIGIAVFIVGIIISVFAYTITSNTETKNYGGVIIDKAKEEPSSGYKSSRDAVYYVIVKDDDCKKAIRVNVDVPTWYSAKIGNKIYFDLNVMELRSCGNGGEHLK